MAVSYALLGLLEGTDRHGYDLKQSYDRRFGADRPVRFGQVYRVLAQLERDGRVQVAGVEPGAGPERKRYAITAEGVTDLETWLSTTEEPDAGLPPVLYTKVVLALLSGRPARAFLDAQRERHLTAMRALTAAKRDTALPDLLLADHRLFHLEADLRWIDHAAARLEALAEELRS